MADLSRQQCADMYDRMRIAVASGRPLPRDVADWWLAAADQYEHGTPLEVGLGLNGESGRAWQHPVRQRRRAAIERLILAAADGAGGRTNFNATRIAGVVNRKRWDMPALSLDILLLLITRYPGEVPTSRSALRQVLLGETQAQRDGLVQTMTLFDSADYSNRAGSRAT
ncbi:hypothetical protein ACS8YF_00340 [Salinisphaera sp. SWV1]|uniref:hypothetical protein n=1 Tax=Salinisphaera sp. SWV1 TaxID=3454139 RepID=UPI003F825248